MNIPPKIKAKVRQQALRAMCCDSKGHLTKNGKVVLAYLRDFCAADGRGNSFPRDATGALDPLGMARAAGRREVYDLLVHMLNVKLEDRHNLEDGLQ